MTNSYYSHKRYLILNIINHLGPISRTELIAMTDYRPASVGAIINELLQEGLIVETGLSSSSHGRKRVLLEINHRYICTAAIAIATDAITYIVAQINGEILFRSTMQIDPNLPKQELASKIIADTVSMINRYKDRNIVGIGICNPPYDPTLYRMDPLHRLFYGNYNQWIEQDLKPRLEEASALPVRTFSAVTLPVLVEQRFGAAKNVQNFVCVELSNGIGASICCNGMPVAGATGVAGELGHTVINADIPEKRLCYCGKAGCVEKDTAFPALAADIQKALASGVSSVLNANEGSARGITAQDVRVALEAGDQLCMHYVKRAAYRLGIAIANLIDILNPEMIVLYGFMLELGDYFLSHLEESIRENTLIIARDVKICTSKALDSVLPLGAAAEMFSDYIRNKDFSWVYQIQPEEKGNETPEDEIE